MKPALFKRFILLCMPCFLYSIVQAQQKNVANLILLGMNESGSGFPTLIKDTVSDIAVS